MKEDKPEEKLKQIALTDTQRENVRKMLARFGGQLETDDKKEDDVVELDEVVDKTQEDLFLGVVPGTTVEWGDLTPGSKKYPFIREICCQFEPYIRGKKEINPRDFKRACVMAGIEPNNNSLTLISCAVQQADPITLLHLQIKQKQNGNILIETLRFIT